MPSRGLFCQCRLVKTDGVSTTTTTSYLPAKFAQVGRVLGLRDSDGEWTEGWKVEQAGELVPKPPDPHEKIKAHRRATGDSNPRARS